ncbi:MAG: carboxypeptidase regulatory-like domain-containing protein [Deltaproteobacteria bacterium]|nr:carboxypeptidase regulatory-like domain-containing protein [Deltaproteobacteria bacterium]MBW1961357.1 carboxypeptidase regulatory-like domain-containing protein [Deltaproteobacteria bacterium]MBW1996281.1 carboxypeptidase regulatory-like domain-containing protein [Deltaproteobacteria bacterium]MBW2152517.1 carboxypeptidase regulatory-like domain-containing protein [Deltaproteobacteria bacterium]
MKNRKIIITLVVGLIFLGMTFCAAYAAQFLQVNRTDTGVAYVSGGVGVDERNEMKKLVKDYNLKLIFATLKGNYLSGITVIVEDASGNHIMETKTDGPWLFARLPSGKYKIISTYKGVKKTQTVEVNSGLATVMFHWS